MNLADYILEKFGDKLYDRKHVYYIITTNGEIYDLNDYEEKGTAVSKPHIFIANLWFISWFGNDPVVYHYPLLAQRGLLLDVYLWKRNRSHYLKYLVVINHFSFNKQAVMEIIDIETFARNTNLSINGVDSSRVKNGGSEEEKKLERKLEEQNLFNGHTFAEAVNIIKKCYEGDKSLIGEVDAINHAYHRVFKPYRVIIPLV